MPQQRFDNINIYFLLTTSTHCHPTLIINLEIMSWCITKSLIEQLLIKDACFNQYNEEIKFNKSIKLGRKWISESTYFLILKRCTFIMKIKHVRASRMFQRYCKYGKHMSHAFANSTSKCLKICKGKRHGWNTLLNHKQFVDWYLRIFSSTQCNQGKTPKSMTA